ncbi:MAG TPA: 2-dehydro-3-deoxygalactonokinase [Paenarthrobacter sp.]|nr:2-dehydro-3-deoxygalactonokinase [Paenarthrobacter sp.]
MTYLSTSGAGSPRTPELDNPQLIALDWGTSSCRAYLLGPDGVVLDSRAGGRGVMAVTENVADRPAAFAAELEDLVGTWIQDSPDLPLLACGMIGSNQGWAEADYRRLPVDLWARPEGLTPVPAGRDRLWIVPGLLKGGPDDGAEALPDVMRGEETQLLGVLPDSVEGSAEHVVVLPGTHTKWVRLTGSVVTDFSTSMTGELYALLVQDSILGRLAEQPRQPDPDAFQRGLDVSFRTPGGPDGVLGTLFSARTLVMTGRLPATGVYDYISGLLIGAEVAAFTRQLLPPEHGVHRPAITICANPTLTTRYARALEQAGFTITLAPSDAAARGLWRTALTTGLVTKETP